MIITDSICGEIINDTSLKRNWMQEFSFFALEKENSEEAESAYR